ncbi:MAG: hypothetical protein SGILL_007176 [Bacillariaceae sp.]
MARRQSSGTSTSRLVEAVRTASATAKKLNAASKSKKKNKQSDSDPTTASSSSIANARTTTTTSDSSSSTRRAMIDSAVEDIMMAQQNNAAASIGVLGESVPQPATVVIPRVLPRPKPGTVLIKSKRTFSGYATNSAKGLVDVRVATPGDDLDIANLRLSVFSDFTPQTRKLFCDRSCHLLATRRQHGATCLVAQEPKRSLLLSPASSSMRRDPIVGTAEISFHEFAGTRLGRARKENSILYVTEVAVNSKFRRKGIAQLMMDAVDKVADIRKVETIFLHVDVENRAALQLYANAGFRKLPSNNPVFYEFTRKLNLHDGATKGRIHYLMCKDLKKPMWLEDIDKEEPIASQRGSFGIEVLQ